MNHILRLQKMLLPVGPPILVLFFTACVSVNLPTNQSDKATNYKMEEPSLPFSKMKTDNADHAWMSSKTGNTIALLTDCNPKSNRSLKSIETDNVTAINTPKILDSTSLEYNDREALQTVTEGAVDGVKVKMYLLVFQKNSCNYTISLIGRNSLVDRELPFFEKFKNGFVAP